MSKQSNKEWYQRSFSSLHLSEEFREKMKNLPEKESEGKIMKMKSVHGISRVAVAVLTVCAIAVGSAGVCYAFDVGGIRTKISLWLGGMKRTVEVEQVDEGVYRMIATNEVDTEAGFGGMTIDDEGNQIPMSAEEMASYMNNDMSLVEEDGRMIFYYKNLTLDVTDEIDAKGTLYIHVEDPSNPNTWFRVSGINGGGYESQADSEPEAGADYFEVDSSGLIPGDPVASENDSDLTQATTVVMTGE